MSATNTQPQTSTCTALRTVECSGRGGVKTNTTTTTNSTTRARAALTPLIDSLTPYDSSEDEMWVGRRCSVAVIIRTPGTRTAGSVRELLAQPEAENASVELLYIRRAFIKPAEGERPNRWAGHVAFPGGHQESGESRLDAAVRETAEEVGLDLTCGFEFVGTLPKKRVFETDIIATPFVFVQLVSETPAITLDPNEVAAYTWCDLDTLMNCEQEPIPVSSRLVIVFRPLPKELLERLNVDEVLCKGWRIFGEEGDPGRFILWGLTMYITADMLECMPCAPAQRYDEPRMWMNNSFGHVCLMLAQYDAAYWAYTAALGAAIVGAAVWHSRL